MKGFDVIRRTLRYIDEHLSEEMGLERIAEEFHFSPYYFHRMFSAVAGRTLAAHIRDRRLERACDALANGDRPLSAICVDCGFDSQQAFSRTFKSRYGVSPSEYRKLGIRPEATPLDEMIVKFTNRIKGGILVHPNLIRRKSMLIAGVTGDGSQTALVWQEFMDLNEKIGLPNRVSDHGVEIRIYDGKSCECHMGLAVADRNVDEAFKIIRLPASEYASFEVYVARGYESENAAMDEWLETNEEGYSQRLYEGKSYAVEVYDERFHGDRPDSIVEIWVPVVKDEARG